MSAALEGSGKRIETSFIIAAIGLAASPEGGAPASPDPAPHPFHAAARACTGGKPAARSIGRDWPRAAGSAIDGATRTANRARQGARRTGLPPRIPAAFRTGIEAGAVVLVDRYVSTLSERAF